MTKDEMRNILAAHLANFRAWSYAQLAERVVRSNQKSTCLEVIEGIAPDGTAYQMEFQAFWDGRPHGNIRVVGDLSRNPSTPLLGFLPVFASEVADAFIMRPDCRFVGE